MIFADFIRRVVEAGVPLFYRREPVEFTYPEGLRGAKRILAILPRDADAVREIPSFRERLLFSMGKRRIIPLSIGVPLEILAEWGAEHLYFTDTEVIWNGWVSRRVIDEVVKRNFSMCVDLSPKFDIITAQIPVRAKIPLRIGVWHRRNFFNISLIASHDPKQFYRQIAYVLENGA